MGPNKEQRNKHKAVKTPTARPSPFQKKCRTFMLTFMLNWLSFSISSAEKRVLLSLKLAQVRMRGSESLGSPVTTYSSSIRCST